MWGCFADPPPIRRRRYRRRLGGQIDRGVAIEEVERPQVERVPQRRHHRQILGPHEVMQADVGPHHEILLADRPILLDPRGQPGAIARIAAGIVARRVAFLRIVTRHPEVVVEEPRPPGGPVVGVEHLVAVVPVQQLVAHPVADGVGDVLVHDHQLLDAMAAVHDRLLFGVRHSGRHDV
jgi:hypothetical protein